MKANESIVKWDVFFTWIGIIVLAFGFWTLLIYGTLRFLSWITKLIGL
ncbi:hypothetical protein M2451_002728 [Dysgonomonas sp. PFB1-18]|nr:hypothetical protein [Dysgonomonas sp. PF1-14]MDH6339749.1 hypothetical protein [Dysgonomonas sp. PF1-16]MDH6381397.1 hypothetical protein [Dysgonomonas sp. PFB1-18]MDH6398612.1 hypothetical protein [Dysgonomonas sp. PF1-23]